MKSAVEMGLLERFYKALVDNTDLRSLKLPHRDVIYIKAHLTEVFKREFTTDEVQELLLSAGLVTKRL